MPIKPSPTIAGKLRKLFNNNKQTIEPAIGDSVPGGSEGGGGLVVQFNMPNRFADNYVSDISAKDVIDAYNSGKNVVFHFNYFYDEEQGVNLGAEGSTTMSACGTGYGNGLVVACDVYNVWSMLNSPSNPIDLSDPDAKIEFYISSD